MTAVKITFLKSVFQTHARILPTFVHVQLQLNGTSYNTYWQLIRLQKILGGKCYKYCQVTVPQVFCTHCVKLKPTKGMTE